MLGLLGLLLRLVVKVSAKSSCIGVDIGPISSTGFNFSFRGDGDGISVIFTGSDEPSNQLASLSTVVLVVANFLFTVVVGSPGSTFTLIWDAATLPGEMDWEVVLCGRRKGRNVEDPVGEEDWVRLNKSGRSAAVRDRWGPLVGAGDGKVKE